MKKPYREWKHYITTLQSLLSPLGRDAEIEETMRPFKIEIYSDVVCPWCFIGKRRIESAMQYYRNAHLDERQPQIIWIPFLLNADIPKEGMDRKAYLTGKFGEKANSSDMFAGVVKAGRAVSINYHLDQIERQPNVIDAHRLIRFAERHGMPDSVVESLFQAFFVDGKDISRHDTLVNIAVHAGLDLSLVHTYLASKEDAQWVLEQDERARGLGIDTVSFVVFNERRGDSAIQPVDALFNLLGWARRDAARPRSMPSIF
jgi:predicted DsbA family dithiol-disulfide isomerase